MLMICGGPSFERDISLNSARAVFDNIGAQEGLDVTILFIDKNRGKHIVSSGFLYSNTTSDFDFKLESEGKRLTESQFIDALKNTDIVFPVLHGVYGEDGELQTLLETLGVPYVGSPPAACRKMYNKENADYELLKANGFYTMPKLYIRANDSDSGIKIRRFFEEYNLDEVVAKPIEGGSSVGVLWLKSTDDVEDKIHEHLQMFGQLVIEPVCKGREFTVIILQNPLGEPVALLPTEIEIINKDNDKIFSKRRKYLATTETHYYCPARFGDDINEKIRDRAQELFRIAGARDFLRIDGWVMDSGELYFSDFNPISGMEQNSFIFQQSARIGLSHGQLIEYILKNSARRQLREFPAGTKKTTGKRKVNVLLGGWTSERQVSLMSGTNVWLKLMHSDKFTPSPFLLFRNGDEMRVSPLPYAVALNHTVEEMLYQMANSTIDMETVRKVRERLGLGRDDMCSIEVGDSMSVDEFIAESKSEGAYVFIGLHGGFGENGDLQAKLEDAGLEFNGSGSKAAKLCMDKYKTGEMVNSLGIEGLRSCRKNLVGVNDKFGFGDGKMIVKPNDDGCSTGVVIVENAEQYQKYIGLLKSEIEVIPAGTFYRQSEKISLSRRDKFLVEEFIEVDDISVEGQELKYVPETGWIELTVGVLERNGVYHSLNPSIAVAASGILSLEEKFQGGTGINITPPPEQILSKELCDKIKRNVMVTAKAAGVKDYARIDIFANNKTGEVIIIEINTLPGLSPSTVLFQQGAKETPSLTPCDL